MEDKDGNQLAEILYSDRKKKKRITKVEKVSKPKHWNPDFDANELKQKQQSRDDESTNS